MNLRGKKVLVTGATGFIGGRLVEKLVMQHGVKVRALVRDFRKAVRIGRFDIEFIKGDVSTAETLQEAAADCDVIFHCAFGSSGTAEQQRDATVNGTHNVCHAAQAAGVKRLVYLSTLSVYGNLTVDSLTESSPRQKTGDVYTDTKIDAEQIVIDAHQNGLPATIIQPTAVYGPNGGWWTAGQIDRLKNGRFALPLEGTGICNAVYVDDVADACIAAADHDDAVGEAFLVSGPQPVTWQAFYEKFEAMIGDESIAHLSVDDIRKRQIKPRQPRTFVGWGLQVLRERPDIRQRMVQSWFGLPYRAATKLAPRKLISATKRMVLGQNYAGAATDTTGQEPTACDSSRPLKPIIVPDAESLPQFTSMTRVSTDKLKTVLGFEPRYELDQGMQLTEQWAAWAGLLA